MSFSLNTTIIKPDQNNKIENAIILFHGYGGDGKDISMLTHNWKRFRRCHRICTYKYSFGRES